MDVGDAGAQRFALGLANSGSERLHLAIDVRFGHVIHIDQHQARDTTARQRFRRPGTDTSQPDDGHARRAYAPVAGIAVQATQTTEAALQVRRRIGGCKGSGRQVDG